MEYVEKFRMFVTEQIFVFRDSRLRGNDVKIKFYVILPLRGSLNRLIMKI